MLRVPALRALAALAVVTLALAPSVRASSIWVVAPTPGPGVDFTNIQAAIDAATPGDVVQVSHGTYPGFLLTKGLSIFGMSTSTVTGEIAIVNVGGGPRVQVARLSCLALSVLDCSRVVMLEDIVVANTNVIPDRVARIERCDDVRMLRTTITSTKLTQYFDAAYVPALFVADARVELTRCSLTGRNGGDGSTSFRSYGGPGTPAIELTSGADVHVALSTLRGGNGGRDFDCGDESCDAFGGDGGDAIRVSSAGARVFVSGRSADLCRGGNGGAILNSGTFGFPGAAGRALRVIAGSLARVSGATLTGGQSGSGITGPAIQNSGTLQQPVPADPTLEMLENAHAPGDIVTFAVHAQPGSSVRLRFGRRPIVEDLPLSAEDRLVENLRAYNLGVVPPSGDVFATILLREDAPLGALYVWQAAVAETNGATEMTQSWPAIFR